MFERRSWKIESNTVRFAQDLVESAVRLCKQSKIKITDQTINDWMCHRLSPDHPAKSILMEYHPGNDIWGNPYQIQVRESLDGTPRVYSTGEDRLSKSDGNDADDIRSWDNSYAQWYSRRDNFRDRSAHLILSVLVTITGYCLILPKRKPKHRNARS